MFVEVYQPIHTQIRAKQHDAKSRYLDVTFLDQGMPFDLGRDDVFLYAVKPDGHSVFNYCEMVDATQGRFMVELTDQLLAVPGCIKAEFVVYGFDGVEILKTYTFIIEVMPTIYDANAVESTNEFNALARLLRKANRIIPFIQDISDRIGWPYPSDAPNFTIFDFLRDIRRWVVEIHAMSTQTISLLHGLSNRLDSIQHLLEGMANANGAFYGEPGVYTFVIPRGTNFLSVVVVGGGGGGGNGTIGTLSFPNISISNSTFSAMPVNSNWVVGDNETFAGSGAAAPFTHFVSNAVGGTGGGYVEQIIFVGGLSSLTVVVGAGGAPGQNGGASTIMGFINAVGGLAGQSGRVHQMLSPIGVTFTNQGQIPPFTEWDAPNATFSAVTGSNMHGLFGGGVNQWYTFGWLGYMMPTFTNRTQHHIDPNAVSLPSRSNGSNGVQFLPQNQGLAGQIGQGGGGGVGFGAGGGGGGSGTTNRVAAPEDFVSNNEYTFVWRDSSQNIRTGRTQRVTVADFARRENSGATGGANGFGGTHVAGAGGDGSTVSGGAGGAGNGGCVSIMPYAG